VRVIGKGRKERCTPLSKNTRTVLAAWMKEPLGVADQPLFPNARGGRLSAHGVHYLLAKHVAVATSACQSLKHKRVSPHVLRHYVAFRTMSRTFYFDVVFRTKIFNPPRHSPAPSVRLVNRRDAALKVQRQRFNGLAAIVGRKAPPVKIWCVGADVRRFSMLRTIRVVAGFGRSQVEMVLKPRWKFAKSLRSRAAPAGLQG
jgi:Phage integrase family